MKIALKTCVLLVITTAGAIHTVQAAHFLANKPDVLTPCFFSDPNFNKCFTKNLQVLFTEWKDGIPGYKKLGTLDPLHVKRISISQDSNRVLSINSNLTDVVLIGASKMIVKDARFNSQTLTSKIKLFLKKFRIDCNYELNGRILNLVLNGKGKSYFEIENFGMLFNLKLKLRDESGHIFTDIEKVKMNITDVGGFHTQFDNLFNGQKDLEDSANSLFNENWRDFYEVLHPAISQTVEVLITDRMIKGYSYVPAEFFLADIPSAAEYYG